MPLCSEYLFYWHLRQDGCIDFKIKLSGELSTNLLSAGEDKPSHGVMVGPDVNAQIHQHMFCARLDMAVDSHKNTVTEVDIISEPLGEGNPYGNCFNVVRCQLNNLTVSAESIVFAQGSCFICSNTFPSSG